MEKHGVRMADHEKSKCPMNKPPIYKTPTTRSHYIIWLMFKLIKCLKLARKKIPLMTIQNKKKTKKNCNQRIRFMLFHFLEPCTARP